MRRITATVCAIVMATVSMAEPTDWHTPSGWKPVDDYVSLEYYDDNGDQQKLQFSLKDGAFPDYIWDLIGTTDVTAVKAIEKALQAHGEVSEVGRRLDSIAENGIRISGRDANGNLITQTLTISTGPNTDGKPIEGTTDAVYDFADGKTISYTQGKYPKLTLYGAPTTQASRGLFPWWGGSTLEWKDPLAFFDGNSVEAQHDAVGMLNTRGIQLAGFSGKDYTTLYNLADYMTNRVDGAHYAVVIRDDSSTLPQLRYMDLGQIVSESVEPFLVDGSSITTNTTDGALVQGEASLRGFASAVEDSGDGAFIIPYVDGGELSWKDLSCFFAENVFKKTDDGKIILNGVEEGDTETRVITVTGGGSDQSVSTFAADNASVDFEATGGNMQLHGFHNVPGFALANDIAAALTNDAVSVANQYLPIVVRVGDQNQIRYVKMAKLGTVQTPAVDETTIELVTDDTGEPPYIQLVGADTLFCGGVYMIGDDGRGKFVGIEGDGSIYSKSSIDANQDEDGNIFITLSGWDNSVEGNGLIGWDAEHNMSYYEGQNFTRGVTLTDGVGPQLAAYPSAAGGIPYSKPDTGNGDSLGWISGNDKIPMLKNNAAPVALSVGQSLTTLNDNLNIAGFQDAAAGKVPTKNASGGITWKELPGDDGSSFTAITFVSDVTWDAATHQLKVTKKTVTAKIVGSATESEEVVFTAASHAQEHQE